MASNHTPDQRIVDLVVSSLSDEDTGEAYLWCCAHADQIDFQKNPAAYLRAGSRSRKHEQTRADASRRRRETVVVRRLFHVPDHLTRLEVEEEVERYMARLTTFQRALLIARYALGYSCQEIARCAGIPDRTVADRTWEARERIKAIFL